MKSQISKWSRMGEGCAVAALVASGIPSELTRHGQVESLIEADSACGVDSARLMKTIVLRRTDGDLLSYSFLVTDRSLGGNCRLHQGS